MPISSHRCPQCGKHGSQLFRRIATGNLYVCESCVIAFIAEPDQDDPLHSTSNAIAASDRASVRLCRKPVIA